MTVRGDLYPRDTDPMPEMEEGLTPPPKRRVAHRSQPRKRTTHESVGRFNEVTKAWWKMITLICVAVGIMAMSVAGWVKAKLAEDVAQSAHYQTEQQKRPLAQQDKETEVTFKVSTEKWPTQGELNSKLVQKVAELEARIAKMEKRDQDRRQRYKQWEKKDDLKGLVDKINEPIPANPTAAVAAETPASSSPVTDPVPTP